MIYAFLLTVDGTSAKNDVRTVSNGLDYYLVGRDPEPSDPTIFNRYVLKDATYLDVNGQLQEITIAVWIGVADEDVSNAVRIELTRQNAAYRQVSFSGTGGPWVHANMTPRLLQFSAENGAVKYWHLIPEDVPGVLTTLQLLAMFQAYPA